MAGTLNALALFPLKVGELPRNPSTYVSARVLGAGVAESITIPGGTNVVRLAGNADFYYVFGAGPATVPVDTDDGSSFELVKVQSNAEWLVIPPGATNISVISAGVCIVTASFYKA